MHRGDRKPSIDFLLDETLALGSFGQLTEITNHGEVRIVVFFDSVVTTNGASGASIRFLNQIDEVLDVIQVVGTGKAVREFNDERIKSSSTLAIKMDVQDRDESVGSIDAYLNPIAVDER